MLGTVYKCLAKILYDDVKVNALDKDNSDEAYTKGYLRRLDEEAADSNYGIFQNTDDKWTAEERERKRKVKEIISNSKNQNTGKKTATKAIVVVVVFVVCFGYVGSQLYADFEQKAESQREWEQHQKLMEKESHPVPDWAKSSGGTYSSSSSSSGLSDAADRQLQNAKNILSSTCGNAKTINSIPSGVGDLALKAAGVDPLGNAIDAHCNYGMEQLDNLNP